MSSELGPYFDAGNQYRCVYAVLPEHPERGGGQGGFDTVAFGSGASPSGFHPDPAWRVSSRP